MEQIIFIDASIQGPAPGRTFCYRSGLAVFEETLNGGVLVSAGCNAASIVLYCSAFSAFVVFIRMGKTASRMSA